jgi:hypothetical protein
LSKKSDVSEIRSVLIPTKDGGDLLQKEETRGEGGKVRKEKGEGKKEKK